MLRDQEQFANGVLAAGLASPTELREYQRYLPPSQQGMSAEAVATLFVQHNWLTAFQANEILHERNTPLVLDDYVVLDCLGRGGMGEVYRAQHRRMERIVALKLIASHLTQDIAIKRFQREVKAAAKLTHPNIVATYDAGEYKGHHYLVMEFVDGEDLDHLADRCTLPPLQTVNLMMQAATGLEYAHSCGVIHRDIKPSNLFLDKSGRLRILDMGIARIDQTLADDGLTHTGQLMGTVDYMAPEQGYDIRNIDGRCDIYSLGCTMYRVLTGNLMYQGDTFLEKARRHERDPIPSLRAACPIATPELEALFHKMVAKLPKDRFQNMKALKEALTDLEQRLSEGPAPARWFGFWGKPDSPRKIRTAANGGAATPMPPMPAGSSIALYPPATPTPNSIPSHTPAGKFATLNPGPDSPTMQVAPETTARKKPTAYTSDRNSDHTVPQSYELPPRRRSWLALTGTALCLVALIVAYFAVSLPRDAWLNLVSRPETPVENPDPNGTDPARNTAPSPPIEPLLPEPMPPEPMDPVVPPPEPVIENPPPAPVDPATAPLPVDPVVPTPMPVAPMPREPVEIGPQSIEPKPVEPSPIDPKQLTPEPSIPNRPASQANQANQIDPSSQGSQLTRTPAAIGPASQVRPAQVVPPDPTPLVPPEPMPPEPPTVVIQLPPRNPFADKPLELSPAARRILETVPKTPEQTLARMNHEELWMAAKDWGRRLAARPKSDEERLEELYLKLLSRKPNGDEALTFKKHLDQFRTTIVANDSAVEIMGAADVQVRDQAAWALVTRALMLTYEVSQQKAP